MIGQLTFLNILTHETRIRHHEQTPNVAYWNTPRQSKIIQIHNLIQFNLWSKLMGHVDCTLQWQWDLLVYPLELLFTIISLYHFILLFECWNLRHFCSVILCNTFCIANSRVFFSYLKLQRKVLTVSLSLLQVIKVDKF